MKKYFDIVESGDKTFWYSGIGLTCFILFFLFFLFFLFRKGTRQQKGIALFLTIFAFIWTSISWITGGALYNESIDALRKNKYSTVSGFVTEFDPMPKEGHKNESFKVNGIKFEYSDFEISCGFNNTKSHGGPIDEGKFVKINYYKGLIIQLWVKDI